MKSIIALTSSHLFENGRCNGNETSKIVCKILTSFACRNCFKRLAYKWIQKEKNFAQEIVLTRTFKDFSSLKCLMCLCKDFITYGQRGNDAILILQNVFTSLSSSPPFIFQKKTHIRKEILACFCNVKCTNKWGNKQSEISYNFFCFNATYFYMYNLEELLGVKEELNLF